MDKKDDTLTDKLNEIKELLEKESKYSYTYINKKKINTEIFFFDSFLITIKKNRIHVYPYKEISFIYNIKTIITIWLQNDSITLNIIHNNDFLSFLIKLKNNYKTIIYDNNENEKIWTKINKLLKGYEFQIENCINTKSINNYYNIRKIKNAFNKKYFIISSTIVFYFVFVIYFPLVYYNLIKIEVSSSILLVFISIIAIFASYKNVKEKTIKYILKRGHYGTISFFNKYLTLQSNNDLYLTNYEINNKNIYQTNSYIYIISRKEKKTLIIDTKSISKNKLFFITERIKNEEWRPS